MHEYGHHHDHAHDHCHNEAAAATCGHDCDHCSAEHDPKEELKALMNYMVKHNRSHCAELEALAKQLKELGDETGYAQVMLAVSDFEKGNMRLSTVLASLK